MLVRDPREISDSIVSSVLDFCRRAQRPASPGEVRLALARLGEDRDREILRIASQKPPATPLSPHAFVDWVLGMPPEQAAALEEAGAYLAVAREAAAEAIDLQLRRDREAAALAKPKPATRRRRKTGTSEPTPLIRRRAKAKAPAEEEAAPETPPAEATEPELPPVRPGRRPAQPQFGRFVSGRPAKRPLQELERAEGAQILRDLIKETHGGMALLTSRLDATWAPAHGRITPAQVEALLARHGLEPLRRKAERDQLRALLRRNRGYDRPVARAFRISTSELRNLLHEHNLMDEVKELRARAREEALAETSLEARLDLIHRHADRLRALGVLRALEKEVLQELRRLVDDFPAEEELKTPEILLEMVRRQEGFDRGLWRWTVDHFGLLRAAARRLGVPLAPPPRPEPRFGEGRARRGRAFGDRRSGAPQPRPPWRDRGFSKD